MASGILITAISSGSGKTAAACALMAAYQAQNKKVSSCKCGPDYIDPMFHKEVLGVDSKNLDLFFSSEDELRKEYAKHAADAELVITEGVMGYYDGMRLDSVTASSYDVQFEDGTIVKSKTFQSFTLGCIGNPNKKMHRGRKRKDK